MQVKNVPKDVIKFYASCNVVVIKSLSEIFSLQDIRKELDEFNDFIVGMDLKEDMERYNLIPIANDGMGGYYVFKANEKDEHIYYLDCEFPEKVDNCVKFDSFNNYLEEIYDIQNRLADELGG